MAGTLTVQNLQGPSSGANANKIIVPSGQKLHAAGHVIQTVTGGAPLITSGTTSVNATPSNHSSWHTIFNVAFTPLDANSIIYVSAGPMQYYAVGGQNIGGQTAICEDATGTVRPFRPTGVAITDYESQGLFYTGTNNIEGTNFWLPLMSHCHTPSWGTTSANISYRVAAENTANLGYTAQGRYNVATMIIMEIAQ